MEKIFASKLFKASTRKSKIRAAWQNPANAELVRQLRSYLDDEYVDEKYFSSDENEDDSNRSSSVNTPQTENKDKEASGDSSKESRIAISSQPPKSPTVQKRSPKPVEDDSFEDLEDLDDPVAQTPEDVLPDIEHEDLVSSSTVSAATALYQSPHPLTIQDELTDDIQEIKDMLNLDSSTAGVCRVQIRETEMWIYYEDKINLNGVMNFVIERIAASGYVHLEFNRLARSENAIVFQVVSAPISSTDTGDEGHAEK